MPHCDPEELSLAALGHHRLSAADAEHARTCPDCSRELRANVEVVRLARETGPIRLTPPPPQVWRNIEQATARTAPRFDPARGVRRGSSRRGGGGPIRRPWMSLAAAALFGAVVGGAAVAAVLSSGGSGTIAPVADKGPTPSVVATAALAPLPDGGRSPVGSGTVDIERVGDSRLLGVSTAALAPAKGFYEVWLIDPDTMAMVSVGTVQPGDSVTVLPIPRGVDLAKYSVVDISDEPLDGDPTHSKVSVLRAELPV